MFSEGKIEAQYFMRQKDLEISALCKTFLNVSFFGF